MDMYDTYKDIFEIFFPNAKICIVSFHIIIHAKNPLDIVRKTTYKKFDKYPEDERIKIQEYKLLKNYKDYLFCYREELNNEISYNRLLNMTISEVTLVKYITEIDERIKKTYYLLQDFLELYRTQNINTIEKELDEYIDKYYDSKIKSFIDFANMIVRWKQEIINSYNTVFDKVKKNKEG